MAGLIFLLVLFAVISIIGIIEFAVHKRNLNSIPVRIHVNGTRGKSSVTRLIAAGLREGGIRAYAKTTGSLPRVITPEGTEYPVFRQSKPNIIEQLRIISFATANRAEALVIECMALQPYLQSLCELKLIKATHGVITNAREDHLDVMGPSERDVALALLGTTPQNSALYTCERDYLVEFEQACSDRGSQLNVITDDDLASVTEEDLAGFSYVEHRDNIALSLKVCLELGVARETALRGMQKSIPDVGATNDLSIDFFGRNIHFVNGFAANDPESTRTIWEMIREKHKDSGSVIMIVNCRIDRPDRSRQLGAALGQWSRADRYILIGSGTYFLIKYAVQSGIDASLIVNAEDLGTDSIFEEILSHCQKKSVVIGVGNIAGQGLELIKYFNNRAVQQ